MYSNTRESHIGVYREVHIRMMINREVKVEKMGEKVKEGVKENIRTLQDYRDRQGRIFVNKIKHGFNTKNIYQETRYMLEEIAELMHAIEKDDKDNILEELSDIVIFAYGCAAVARVGNLDDKIFEKMEINENRVYTKGKDGDFVKIDTQEEK